MQSFNLLMDDLNEGLAASFLPDLEAAHQAERRHGERLVCGSHVGCRVILHPGAEFRALRVHNLSARGTKLLLDRPAREGTLLNLVFRNEKTRFLCQRQLCVIYSFPDLHGRFVVGGAFHRDLSHDELYQLV
jgi:hypothetical protein